MRNLTPLFDEQERMVEVDRLTADIQNGEDQVLNGVVALISAHFCVPISLVSIVERDYQTFKAKIGIDVDCTAREVSFCDKNLHSSDILEICDTWEDARFSENPLVTSEPFARYYAGAPLITKPGIALGSLCIIDHKARNPMSSQDEELLKNSAKIVVARLQSIHNQAFFDPMTGLPNRQRFDKDLHDAGTRQTAVLIEPLPATGMDKLTKALGIAFFESFMLKVKELLLSALPPGIRLYRANTLSFAFMINPKECEASKLLSNIVAEFGHPLHCENIPVFADVGIGVLNIGRDSQSLSDSIRLMSSVTDLARQGEKHWLYYDKEVDYRLRRSAILLNAIETALISPDQLRLVYQPRVNLASNQCIAAEALLRWSHPTLGEIAPDEFINLAETTASIRNVTRWVVQHVCSQLSQWKAQGLTMTVSLNISAIDLTDSRLFDVLSSSINQFDVSPTQIELEFTENVLVPDFDTVREQLHNLRGMGIAIGIDDFGSGYSNWSYLRQIPATSVKLDRSLLEDLNPGTSDWHIVRGLISLAQSLNLTVVAEGVETELHYHLLRGWGCQEGQGYYFAKPLSPIEFVLWLHKWNSRNIQSHQSGK